MTRKSLRRARMEDNKKGMEGINFHRRVELIQRKTQCLANIINGRYYLERCNMIAEQLNSGKIEEKIDGAAKTMSLMKAEYGLMKLQALTRMRNAHFDKEALKKEFGLTDEQLATLENNFYDEKIVRDDYGDEFRKPNKAEFVLESEDKKS